MDQASYPLRRHVKLIGAMRLAVLDDAQRWYADGMPVRTIAMTMGRSYGFVHRLLSEGGVEMRRRGSRAKGQVEVEGL